MFSRRVGASAAVGERDRWIEQGGEPLLHSDRYWQARRLPTCSIFRAARSSSSCCWPSWYSGPEKLPNAIRQFTKTYAELKKMSTGFQYELQSALDEPMREMRETANLVRDAADPSKLIRRGRSRTTARGHQSDGGGVTGRRSRGVDRLGLGTEHPHGSRGHRRTGAGRPARSRAGPCIAGPATTARTTGRRRRASSNSVSRRHHRRRHRHRRRRRPPRPPASTASRSIAVRRRRRPRPPPPPPSSRLHPRFDRRDHRRTLRPAPEETMTLTEHLGELRMRIIRSALAVTVGMVFIIAFYDQVLDFLVQPYKDLCLSKDPGFCDPELFIMAPTEGLSTRLRVGMYGGIILALPVILWQLWRFIVPALNAKEKKYAIPFVLSSVILFCAGGALAYLTVAQALEFLISLGRRRRRAGLLGAAATSASSTLMIVAFGIGFLLPVLLVFLQLVGVAHAADAAQGDGATRSSASSSSPRRSRPPATRSR